VDGYVRKIASDRNYLSDDDSGHYQPRCRIGADANYRSSTTINQLRWIIHALHDDLPRHPNQHLHQKPNVSSLKWDTGSEPLSHFFCLSGFEINDFHRISTVSLVSEELYNTNHFNHASTLGIMELLFIET